MKDQNKHPRGADSLRSGIWSGLSPDEQKLLSAFDSECEILVKDTLSTPIHLVKRKDIIQLNRLRSSDDHSTTDFSMTLRLKSGHKQAAEWWPIEMKDRQSTLTAEKSSPTGKTMTNVSIQDELIEVADAWGKNLIGQRVLKELNQR
jgi:hypothetical protein